MNYQNQLTLLSDILKNQQQEQYGTEDEFNQIYRLAESLQRQGMLDENMQQTLSNIANFCSNRNCAENKAEIEQWIQAIDQLS